MHTFLFFAHVGSTGKYISSVLERSSSIVTGIRPNIGETASAVFRLNSAMDGGWYFHQPADERFCDRISGYADDRRAVIVWGDLYTSSEKNAAETLNETWRQGGIDNARSLNGSFSAIMMDLVKKSVCLVSDLVGKRRLRYFVDQDFILVSPHDIPIIATSLCPVEWDHVSAASIASCGWSLMGRSLIRNIHAVDPHTIVNWNAGTLSTHYRPLIDASNRIQPSDRTSVSMKTDSIIEAMRQSTASFAGGSSTVESDLTAGVDSRALLGILLSVFDKGRVKLATSGTTDQLDVSVSAKIADKLGIDHSNYLMNDPGDTFLANCRLRAFIMNGDTNARRALGRYPNIGELMFPKFHGGGGEIYRGFYYPREKIEYYRRQMTLDSARKCLARKVLIKNRIEHIEKSLVDGVNERLDESISTVALLSELPADVLDLYYIYERYAHWGSIASRQTWKRWMSPFEVPDVIRMAFELPPPIGAENRIHKAIIRKYLSELYWWPVNGESYLPLSGDALWRLAARGGLAKFRNVKSKLLGIIGRENGVASVVDHATMVSHHLKQGLQDCLMEQGSISATLMSRKVLENYLHMHITGKKSNLRLIGYLITLEMYRVMARTASEEAIKDLARA
jgi:hypothetical protein